MRHVLLLAGALVFLGCSLTVPAGDSEERSSRYDDCRKASRDYCRDVAKNDDHRTCVSKATFECVSGR